MSGTWICSPRLRIASQLSWGLEMFLIWATGGIYHKNRKPDAALESRKRKKTEIGRLGSRPQVAKRRAFGYVALHRSTLGAQTGLPEVSIRSYRLISNRKIRVYWLFCFPPALLVLQRRNTQIIASSLMLANPGSRFVTLNFPLTSFRPVGRGERALTNGVH